MRTEVEAIEAGNARKAAQLEGVSATTIRGMELDEQERNINKKYSKEELGRAMAADTSVKDAEAAVAATKSSIAVLPATITSGGAQIPNPAVTAANIDLANKQNLMDQAKADFSGKWTRRKEAELKGVSLDSEANFRDYIQPYADALRRPGEAIWGGLDWLKDLQAQVGAKRQEQYKAERLQVNAMLAAVRTPMEVFNAEVEKLLGLKARKMIDGSQFTKLANGLVDDYAKAGRDGTGKDKSEDITQNFKLPDAITWGSGEMASWQADLKGFIAAQEAGNDEDRNYQKRIADATEILAKAKGEPDLVITMSK